MTALLIALVSALLIVNLAQLLVTRHAIDAANESRRDAADAIKNAHADDKARYVAERRLRDLQTQYNALLKRQQNRRDAAAVQSGPLTGVIPDARD